MEHSPIACPICWDHDLTQVKDVELIALKSGDKRPVFPVRIYRCSSWHIFAVFVPPHWGSAEEVASPLKLFDAL